MSDVPIGPITYSPGKCTRITDGPVEAPTGFCLQDAALHVFWNKELENGFTCSDHLGDIERWAPYSTHTSQVPPCGVTGAIFQEVVMEDGTVESWCDLEDGGSVRSAELVVAVGGTKDTDA